MYATNQFRKGLKIEIEGVPFQIVDFQHVSPGKGAAFTRTKIRNMLNQNVIERTFKSGDKVDRADTEEREMQYLYGDAEGFHFMNNATYDQVVLSKDQLGEQVGYLKENLVLQITYFNERPIGVEFPTFVELYVKEADPAVKGDTVSGASKYCTLESGARIMVPMHIKEGDLLKVDTRDGTYSEKVNK
ncbi:MAG: elongation factor P [Bacteriovoracia bacterium]